MAEDNKEDANELTIAGQYEFNLNNVMVDNFLEASRAEHNSYRHEMLNVSAKMNKALIEIGYMDKEAAAQHLEAEELTHEHICDKAEDAYRTLFDKHQWPAARPTIRDSKTPYAKMAKTFTPDDVQNHAYALIHQQTGSKGKAKPDDICLNCGEKGHWARDCKSDKKPKRPFNNNKKSKHQKDKHGSSWKTTPPALGAPETKKVRGKDFNWCAHCGRWSTTHARSIGVTTPTVSAFIADQVSTASSFLADQVSFMMSQATAASAYLFTAASTVIAAFEGSPTNRLAPLLWFTLLILVSLPTKVQHRLIGSPPQEFRPFRMTKAKYKRYIRHCRRQRRPTSFSHRRRTRHYGLATRRRLDPQSQDIFDLVQHIIQFSECLTFCRSRREGDNWRSNRRYQRNHNDHNDWQRTNDGWRNMNDNEPSTPHPTTSRETPHDEHQRRRPGDPNWTFYQGPRQRGEDDAFRFDPPRPRSCRHDSSRHRFNRHNPSSNPSDDIFRHFNTFPRTDRMRRQRMTRRRQPSMPRIYRPTVGVGLPMAHVAVLSSPTAKAFFRNADIPQQFSKVINCFRAAMNPDELKSDMSGDEKTARYPIIWDSGATTSISPYKDDFVGKLEPAPLGLKLCGIASGLEIKGVGHVACIITSTLESNHNLSPAEKELLRWHHRLGHLNFSQIQFLLRTGVLAHSESARRLQAAASRITTYPLCPACQFGKQRRRPSPGKTSRVVRDREGVLKNENLFPGQKVSVDHFECTTRGRLLHTFGKEDPKTQYTGGCIFVDHATGYVFVEHQVHLNTQETLSAKISVEEQLQDFGVVVLEYLSDNGRPFTSQEYNDHLLKFSQIHSFAGVGAHHHNGIAERSIQTIMSIAQTMMMHQAIHWPDVTTTTLWPLAVDHAVFLYNHMPNQSSGLSPHDLLTKTRWKQSQLADVQVWGCPVYVLDKQMQDGKKLPRWKPRSTRQIYVGMSKRHASSVPLCLNPDTGAITTQFHIVFDPTFSTVATNVDNLPDFGSEAWSKLFGDSVYQYVLDDPEDPLHPPDPTDDPPPPLTARVREQTEVHTPPTPLDVVPPPTKPQSDFSGATIPSIQKETVIKNPPAVPPVQPPPSQRENVTPTPTNPPQPTPPPARKPQPTPTSKTAPLPSATRTSRRSNKAQPPKRFGYDGHGPAGYNAPLESQSPETNNFYTYFLAYFNSSNIEVEHSHDCSFVPSSYKARATKDPDVFTYNEAVNGPNSEKWTAAAKKEIEELEGKLTWIEVPMSKAKTKIIPGTWVFRVKRNPSGEMTKFKARYCVRGDLEEMDVDKNTFAPTVAWSTVRLFLVLCLILGWATVSVDFSNAFVQSKLDKPKWVHLPRGFVSPKGKGTCLQLNKSLYGTKAAPALWNKTAVEGFTKCGFKQSDFDPCLLYKKGMMVVLYVDDAGIGAKDPADIDKLIEELRELQFELKKEGDFNEFLGIKFDKRKAGSVELTQTGLIDKVWEAARMTDCNPNQIPATGPLGKDPDGEPMNEEWNYRSIVGMLMYLLTNTRPDITFAVSQVARFSSEPKQSHATAVKTILRYLKRTRTKGMIIKPTGKLNLDLFVDADFCGLYNTEPHTDPNSVRSRTGFIVKLSNCPLIWRSQLQTSITCSTLEAKYNALSSALKTLIPLKRLLIEATDHVELDNGIRTTIRASAFEDNQGAYFLATNQRITSRTRWYLNKWHWFWQHVKDGVGPETVAIHELDTSLQDADYFTKAQSCEPFESNRFQVQGW
ncbi:unnamed protein product [Cylindrotheca closterium]|uniref:Uncharacterized protein n=1 Tax=Cylindrotheca closterium TaxID=2856 RepID=A0AAD2CR66_9STRA|nr:unnamed protein product [Cylindrotheca closterium]